MTSPVIPPSFSGVPNAVGSAASAVYIKPNPPIYRKLTSSITKLFTRNYVTSSNKVEVAIPVNAAHSVEVLTSVESNMDYANKRPNIGFKLRARNTNYRVEVGTDEQNGPFSRLKLFDFVNSGVNVTGTYNRSLTVLEFIKRYKGANFALQASYKDGAPKVDSVSSVLRFLDTPRATVFLGLDAKLNARSRVNFETIDLSAAYFTPSYDIIAKTSVTPGSLKSKDYNIKTLYKHTANTSIGIDMSVSDFASGKPAGLDMKFAMEHTVNPQTVVKGKYAANTQLYAASLHHKATDKFYVDIGIEGRANTNHVPRVGLGIFYRA